MCMVVVLHVPMCMAVCICSYMCLFMYRSICVIMVMVVSMY